MIAALLYAFIATFYARTTPPPTIQTVVSHADTGPVCLFGVPAKNYPPAGKQEPPQTPNTP